MIIRYALLSTIVLLATSACAMLPTPPANTVPTAEGTVSYTATPTANTRAPTFGTVTAPTGTITSAPVAQPPVQFDTASTHMNQGVPAASGQVAPVVNAYLVQSTGAGETLVPVNVGTPVKSGDVLEYRGLFTNQGADRVRTMDVTLSIDDKLELIGGISPEIALASNDGSRFVRMPIRVRVGGELRELPLAQYRGLRWTVEDLGIGATAVVKYRAKVK